MRIHGYLLVSGLLLLAPSAGSAQGIGVTPTIGAFIPASDLRDLRDGAERVRLERRGTLGLGLNLDAGSFRGTLAYATGATLTDRGTENLGNVGDGSVLAVAADIVVRPLPRVLVQPYLLGGAGVKRQDFSYRDEGTVNPFPRDRTDFTLHFGLGADLALGGLGIVAEVSDFVSRNADDSFGQHDAFAMVGIRLRFGGSR